MSQLRGLAPSRSCLCWLRVAPKAVTTGEWGMDPPGNPNPYVGVLQGCVGETVRVQGCKCEQRVQRVQGEQCVQV